MDKEKEGEKRQNENVIFSKVVKIYKRKACRRKRIKFQKNTFYYYIGIYNKAKSKSHRRNIQKI